MLDPASLRAAIRTATTTSAPVNMTMGTQASGFEPVSGRSSSIHPRGLTHRSQVTAEDESATIRMRYDAASTPAPARLASWRVANSCEVRMPTAMNIAAAATAAVAKNTAGPAPMSTFLPAAAATVSTAVGTQRATRPTPRPTVAWTAAAPRVAGPARKSSHLPASSSPRKTRVAMNRPQMAPRMITVYSVLYAVYPATVSMR